MKKLALVLLAFLVTACALPDMQVKTGSPKPTLMIKGAPKESILIVDGLKIGKARDYDGDPKVLILEEGVHQVEIEVGTSIVHTEKIYIDNGETKTIQLNTGETK